MNEDRPFLTIVTRSYRRPQELVQNCASVDAQTDQDIQHLILVDPVGRGMWNANRSLYWSGAYIEGGWGYILDDDNYLIEKDFVRELKKIVGVHNPHVIMVKSKMAETKQQILPGRWGKGRPALCQIDSLNFVVRIDIWKEYIVHFGVEGAGDYHFISRVWKKRGLLVHWWDKVVAHAPRVGRIKS